MASKRFLIDTQVFIWLMEKSNKFPSSLFDVLSSPQNQIFLSVASVWEIIIKKEKKKLKLSANIKADAVKSGFSILPIEMEHVLGIEKLPHIHKDPFDRILIAQSKVERLIFITVDKTLHRYNTKFLKLKN
ncbi:MAG: hypothetical protein A3A51_01660 [Candidatus Levybacteria bacterium RIFCSPLOWO2_01_FULL_39_10]|nr:MAG: hypothetical protein A3A51_01660 [Candidatus Levybacteria bacterium RIFCSPLOWO2_01_FULL_39_10]